MPTYEYLCASCEKGFQLTLTFTQRSGARVKCPSCGSKSVTPQLTAFTVKTSRKS